MQVLATLSQRGELDTADVMFALNDAHPAVKRHGIRLSEGLATSSSGAELLAKVCELAASQSDGQVRLQAACSLGAWPNAQAADALAQLVLTQPEDRFLRAAAISSLTPSNVQAFVDSLLKNQTAALSQVGPSLLPLTFKMMPDEPASIAMLDRLATGSWSDTESGWVYRVVGQILDYVESRPGLNKLFMSSSVKDKLVAKAEKARVELQKSSQPSAEDYRMACMTLINRSSLGSSRNKPPTLNCSARSCCPSNPPSCKRPR